MRTTGLVRALSAPGPATAHSFCRIAAAFPSGPVALLVADIRWPAQAVLTIVLCRAEHFADMKRGNWMAVFKSFIFLLAFLLERTRRVSFVGFCQAQALALTNNFSKLKVQSALSPFEQCG